jgi:hypothetical protein
LAEVLIWNKTPQSVGAQKEISILRERYRGDIGFENLTLAKRSIKHIPLRMYGGL